MTVVNRNMASVAAVHAGILADARREAIRQVNEASGQARLAWITWIPGQEMLYLRKEDQARAYLADTRDPVPLTDYPLIAAEVGTTAPTAYELAQLWVNIAALFQSAAAQLETIRLGTIAVIEAAPSRVGIETALLTFHNTLTAALGGTP